MWCLRSPSSRSSRLGWSPTRPALATGPTTNTGAAAPWSVPGEAFSRHAAAELAEGQDGHAVGLAGGGQVRVEGGDRVGELGQEGRVGAELVGVGVEPVERRVEDPRAEPRLDDLGDQLEPPGQAEVRVLRAVGRVFARPAPAACSNRRPSACCGGGSRGAGRRPPRRAARRVERVAPRLGGRSPCRRAGAGTAPGSSSEGTSVRFDLQRQGHRPAADVQRRHVVARPREAGIEGPAEPAGLEASRFDVRAVSQISIDRKCERSGFG